MRGFDQLIHGYLSDQSVNKPLSLAVFGPPGAGKSFGVKQLVDKDETPILEFNLSEVDETHLGGFFHKIRDLNLENKTPLCFFDEFDSNGRQLLKSFLAPMQDGAFREGESVRPIGRGVFVFAGGTAASFDEFANKDDFDEQGHGNFKSLKVPDFLSRLSGKLDVKGPNPEGISLDDYIEHADKTDGSNKIVAAVQKDPAHYLRRAILLRVKIEEFFPAAISSGDDVLSIEERLLNALLRVPFYLHGARSMELLLKAMGPSAQKRILSASDLPADEQMALFVRPEDFRKLLAQIS